MGTQFPKRSGVGKIKMNQKTILYIEEKESKKKKGMKKMKKNNNEEEMKKFADDLEKSVRLACRNARGGALSLYIEAMEAADKTEEALKSMAADAAILDTARNNEKVSTEITCSLMATAYLKMRLRTLAKAIRNEEKEN